RRITTIEGLSPDRGHPLQQAWIAEQVPQCGYCQSGMIMAAAALLAERRDPSDREIDAVITKICRGGTYQRGANAIHPPASGGGGRLTASNCACHRGAHGFYSARF